MPDPLDELDVIAESKAEAEARIKANESLIAVLALKAFVEGHDPREIAERCGYDLSRPKPAAGGEHVVMQMPGGGFMQLDAQMAGWLGVGKQTNRDAAHAFADWLSNDLRERIIAALAVG